MTTNLTYSLGTTSEGQLQTLRQLKTAFAKAIFHCPAIAEQIEQDPELKHLHNLYMEADVQQHYIENDLIDQSAKNNLIELV
jgi:hypothetical protein